MQTITGTQDKPLSFLISSCYWVHSGIRHPHLNSLFNSFFNCLVMTKPLPLGINGIDTSARKDITFSDKSLPINLVFILFARISTCDFKYFYKFSHCKPCSLAWGPSMSMLSGCWVYCIHSWSILTEIRLRYLVCWRVILNLSYEIRLWA